MGLIADNLPVLIPEAYVHLRANAFQTEHPLDPFDALLLAQAIAANRRLITRDERFRNIANILHSAFTPEDAVAQIQE